MDTDSKRRVQSGIFHSAEVKRFARGLGNCKHSLREEEVRHCGASTLMDSI